MTTRTMSPIEAASFTDVDTLRPAVPAPHISKLWSTILILSVLMSAWLLFSKIF